MIRGTTLFICTKCKKVFLALDVEYHAMAYSVPMPCERCGSRCTLPMKLSPFLRKEELNPDKPLEEQLWDYSIYKSIWGRTGSNGCAEQVDMPDEQYRIGMSYLDGTSWSHHSSDVSFYWLMKAARQGHVQAQYQVGLLLRGRKPVPEYLQNPPFCYSEGTAYQWISKAAEQGLPEAMWYFGNCRAEDLEKAVAWYQKAIASDCCAASEEAYKKAKRLSDEGLAKPEIPAVKEWYRTCIAKGHREMWYDLGRMYQEGKEGERDLKEAFRCYLIAARTAHVAEAQYAVACMYEQGEGIQPDLHEAVHWYKEAAKQGHQKSAEICLRLALFYETGNGVEQNFQEAWECYLSAWNAGSEQAYKEVKRLWDEGRVNLGISTEKDWCRKWIDQGYREMWYDLGKLYDEGKEGERDVKEAFQCYLIAARTAHVAEAQYAVARMYEQGEGVEPDLHKAVHWYKEAAKQGHAKAQAACRRLEEQ